MEYRTLIEIEKDRIREHLKWQREKEGDTREVTEEDINEFIRKCIEYNI